MSNYKEGQRDGVTTWYDENGKKLMTIDYKAGRFEGKQETFYPNGNLKTSKECRYNFLFDVIVNHGSSQHLLALARELSTQTSIQQRQHLLQVKIHIRQLFPSWQIQMHNYIQFSILWYLTTIEHHSIPISSSVAIPKKTVF